MIRLTLLSCMLLLTACAGPQKLVSQPPDHGQWQRHQQQVKGVQQWDIQGRVAVQTEDSGGQADLFWQRQNPQHYDIRLIAPFGGGSTYLQGRAEGVVLTTSSGEQLFEQNVDRLLYKVQGWHFPVSGLQYWLLGVPSPDSRARLLNWTLDGQLQLMEQDGWRIEMRGYRQVANVQLPKKLYISRLDNDELEVRLVIRRWGLEQN